MLFRSETDCQKTPYVSRKSVGRSFCRERTGWNSRNFRFENTDYYNIKGAVAAMEINLSTVYSLPTTAKTYKPIPKYPSVIEDISAIFAKQSGLDEIYQTAKKAGLPIVKNVEVIDVFHDKKLGSDKKSVTLRLTYQKSDGTPAQEEVIETRNKVNTTLEKSLLAQIRK